MNWVEMLFIGDSLTSGSRDEYGLSWPYYLSHQAIAHRDSPFLIVPTVDAVPGRTSGELIRAVLPVIRSTEAKEGFILIGTNDAKPDNMTPVDTYMGNVMVMYQWMKWAGVRPYVLTIPVPTGFGSAGYTQETVTQVELYNQALRSHFHSEELIDLSAINSYVDGIHFSSAANQQIAGLVLNRILGRRTFRALAG